MLWNRRVPNAVPRPTLMRCAPALVAATPAPGSPGVADGVPGQTVANPNATRALVKSSKVRAVGCGSALKKKYPLTLLFSNPAPVWRRRVPPEDRGRRLHGAQLSGRGRTHARRPRLRTRRCLRRPTRPETRRQRGCPATPLGGGSGGSPCESPPLPKHVYCRFEGDQTGGWVLGAQHWRQFARTALFRAITQATRSLRIPAPHRPAKSSQRLTAICIALGDPPGTRSSWISPLAPPS